MLNRLRHHRRRSAGPVSGVVVGRRVSGLPLVIPAPSGDPTHVLISGETGSGKSVFQRAWIAATAELPDVAFVGMDPKLTSLPVWRPRFTAVATSVGDCTRLMVMLWREVFRRLDLMETAGVDEWHPDLGGPFMVVPIDELTEVVAVDGSRVATELGDFLTTTDDLEPSTEVYKSHTDTLRKELAAAKTMRDAQGVFLSSLARVCRSSGVTILAATQYPTVEVLDSQVKANLSLRVMLRVASQEMVGVCLGMGHSADVSARSISPDEPGGCWIAGLEARPLRARGHFVTVAQARARAAQTAHLRWPSSAVFVGQGLTNNDPFTTTRPVEPVPERTGS